MKRIIEICANSAWSCVEAEAGGASRVELCAGIPEGGTTPSYGEIKTAQALTSQIAINVIIRPRGGDFLYTEAEIQSMLLDIELCKQLGVHGVVFGCLTQEGDIDVPLMRRLIEAAKPLSVTCHRAFDVCRDPFAALEQLIELGVTRVLTSGQMPDAFYGAETIREMIEFAQGAIQILPGGGIKHWNIDRVISATGCTQVHVARFSNRRDNSTANNTAIHFGGALYPPEDSFGVTDSSYIASLRALSENNEQEESL